MEIHEAIEQAESLKRLFPTMNLEQQATLAKEFEPFGVDVVSVAIVNHYRTHSFVNAANLIADIEGRSARKKCLERQGDAVAEARRRREAIEADQRRADQDVERAFATVARLPKGEVDRIKDELAAEHEKNFPYLARRVREADPTKSPMVAALICKRLNAHHGAQA